ncbi:hypothetical protein BHE90_001823 [Fusarium euwallaceae]|uniref:Mitochondrial division protein 1 n=1 Tax=Fusarium euwallaceae TaxID=1147111 RepID=A0A430M6N4_9HYPO|nr:hypothetical protein BHE90_001823 [Fusarium euwallaceae]
MTGKQIDSIKVDGGHRMRFSSDGECSLSTNQDGSAVFWNSSTGGEQYPSMIFKQTQHDLSSDGKVAVWTLENGTALVLSYQEGEGRYLVCGKERSFSQITLSPDGQLLAVNRSGMLHLWDLNLDRKTWEFPHVEELKQVCFSPDSRLIASVQVRRVVVHDAGTGNVLQQIEGHTSADPVITFTPDGWHIALASNRTIRLWHLTTGKEVCRFEHTCKTIRQMAFSPDGCLLAASSTDMILLWDTTVKNDIDGSKGYGDSIASLSLSRDGSQAVSVSADGDVGIWDLNTARQIGTVSYPPMEKVIGASFSHTQEDIVWLASRSGTVRYHNFISGEEIFADYFDEQPHTAQFSPDGNMVAFHSGTVQIWNLLARRMQGTLDVMDVRSTAFSPDSDMIATLRRDNDVVIWDLASGRIKQILNIGHHIQESHSAVAVSLHHSTLAVASSSAEVTFWDINSGVCLSTISVDDILYNISFDPAKLRLITDRGSIMIPPPSRPRGFALVF